MRGSRRGFSSQDSARAVPGCFVSPPSGCIARVHERPGAVPPEPEDTTFALLLLNLVAWSDALAGAAFRRAFDLPGDRETARRFRAWVVRLVGARLR